MKNITILCLLMVSLTIFSCKYNGKDSKPEVVTVDTKANVDHTLASSEVEFNDPKVGAVYNQYLKLETALINSDEVKTASEAANLLAIIEDVDDDKTTLRAIQNIRDSQDIEAQRIQFVAINTAMEDILTGALKSGTIYKQYCPMAFDNTGGSWFSSSKDILNPYFGDKMLKCGRVEAEIK